MKIYAMTSQDFKNRWINLNERLSPLKLDRLNRFGLLPRTVDFLTIAGLPGHASPELSFANDSDDIVYGINKLTEQYDFWNDKKEYEKYIVIGSCRDGDAIAIDTKDEDQIVQLDHEDLFRSSFFNSSILTLADFLIIYRDFEASVLAEHGEEGYRVGYFTDIQFDSLKNKMFEIDQRAITQEGFWKQELEILVSLRQDYLNT